MSEVNDKTCFFYICESPHLLLDRSQSQSLCLIYTSGKVLLIVKLARPVPPTSAHSLNSVRRLVARSEFSTRQINHGSSTISTRHKATGMVFLGTFLSAGAAASLGHMIYYIP